MAYGPPPGPGGYGSPPGGYGPPGGGYPPPAGSWGQVPSPYGSPGLGAPIEYSEKSRATAFILGYLCGIFGVDRFYRGQVGLGVLKLLTCGGLGLWVAIDNIMMALGEAKDVDGKLLSLPTEVVGTPTVNGNHILLASMLGGSLGLDRFMLGQTGLGVLKLLTCGGLGIWHLIDVILCANGSLRDAQGNSLRWR
jgi:TM2 domain-containing membrane protein YozV